MNGEYGETLGVVVGFGAIYVVANAYKRLQSIKLRSTLTLVYNPSGFRELHCCSRLRMTLLQQTGYWEVGT
jgi:hypothetical protein